MRENALWGDVHASCTRSSQGFPWVKPEDVLLFEEGGFIQEFADEDVEVPRRPAFHEGIHLL